MAILQILNRQRQTRHCHAPSIVLALVMGVGILTGAFAQTPSAMSSAADANIEAPLMGGNLGRATEASTIGGGAAAAGLANGIGSTGIQGLGGRTSLPNQLGQPGSGVQNQNANANLGALPALAQTQFQRFVQEAIGKALPLYGYNLFDRSRFPSLTDVPVPANYVVGPGDEIDLKIWGALDLAMRLPVDRNGQITVPKVGPVTVAGTQASELDAYLKKQVGRVYNNFELSASIGRLRSMQIFVVGQARNPGAYTVSSLSTLVSALFESGGPAANGSMRAVQLVRSGKTVTTIDLYKFIHSGETAADSRLIPGDVIVIPPVGPRVAVTGAFDQAAIYELKSDSDTISSVLSMNGGVPTLATPKKALLERIDPASTPPRQVRELVLDAQGLRTNLKDADVLTLLNISPAFANAVTLQGVVADPVRASWFEGMKVSDLIPDREALITKDYYKRKNGLVQLETTNKDAGQNVDNRIRSMVDQINWDYAVIERLDRSKLSTQLIPFNLGKAVLQKDQANNLSLLPGDVVTILSQHDLQLPQEKRARMVRLEGEVAAPGVYQVQAGETLPQLIRRVGGLTPQAYVFGTELNRESIKTQQQENLDKLIRRMEAQAQSQQGSILANRGSSSDSSSQATALVQLQQAQLKSQIERLKSFKSSGRLSLELDPANQNLSALPDLPLEDGDRILLPSMPGFVGAFGSVNNENMFIYRKGKTVSDVIKSAGLTEDAEPDQAFVLRADGSIISRNDHNGFFGGNFDSLALMPGDTLVMPAKIDRESKYNTFIRGAKDWTQILSNLGIGVAAWRSMGY